MDDVEIESEHHGRGLGLGPTIVGLVFSFLRPEVIGLIPGTYEFCRRSSKKRSSSTMLELTKLVYAFWLT